MAAPPYGKPDAIGVRFQRYSATADWFQAEPPWEKSEEENPREMETKELP